MLDDDDDDDDDDDVRNYAQVSPELALIII